MVEASRSEKPRLEDLVIRAADSTDLSALEWDGLYLKYRRMYQDIYRRALQGIILMWIVETRGGEMIGQAFVLLKGSDRRTADGRRRAYVFAFRIRPAFRNRGIGSHLMTFVERDLMRRGFKTVTLNVAKDNPDALRLYRRLGYRVIGSQPGKWSYKDHEGKLHHVDEPAWRMIKSLKRNQSA